jgi:hypothetical protein
VDSILETIEEHEIVHTNKMVLYFTDSRTAAAVQRTGIPSVAIQGGVIVHPYIKESFDHNTVEEFEGNLGGNVIVVLSVLEAFLSPRLGFPQHLIVSDKLLRFFAGNGAVPCLSRSTLVRLITVEAPSPVLSLLDDGMHPEPFHSLLAAQEPEPVETSMCQEISMALSKSVKPSLIVIENKDHLECLIRILKVKAACFENYEIVYHYTNDKFLSSILKDGLRMSQTGQEDGGVYFTLKSPIDFAYGTTDYEMNLIKDCFGVERAHEYIGQHRLDIVIVYLCYKPALDTVHNRAQAKIVHKALFEHFATSHNGAFYLPSDFIVACLKVIG